MIKNLFKKLVKLSARTLGLIAAGFVIALFRFLGVSNIVSLLVVLGVTFFVIKEFVKIAKKKNNFWQWLSDNLIIVLGVDLGIGAVLISILGIYALAFIILSPAILYIMNEKK